jgi:hypothetical protein
MPYPNFHAARIRSPDDFEKILVLKTLSNGVMIYGGPLKLKPANSNIKGTTAQSYRFPLDKFTASQAKAWLQANNIKFISFEPATEEINNNIRKAANG